MVAAALALACGGAAIDPPPLAFAENLVVTGTIVTMNDRFDVLRGGTVVVSAGRIAAVLRRGRPLPRWARAYPRVAGGTVYPGLVNPHDHLVYDTLPPWDVPLFHGRPLVSVDDWRDGPLTDPYLEAILFPRRDLLELGRATDMGRWAELKGLVAGTTTTQGSFGFNTGGEELSKGFAHTLARNVDIDNDHLAQSAGGIYEHETHKLNRPQLDYVYETGSRYLVHLSEGRGAKSLHELAELNDFGRGNERCGALMSRTSIIHGTPYGPREFALLARCGTDLVTATLGNLLYYGRAPDLALALDAGVNVSISTDWTPVGSRNLLEELKVVDFLSRNVYAHSIPSRTLVSMVTRNPARALGWERHVGGIVTGLRGDLLVLERDGGDPYRRLIRATEQDVELVTVDGDPLAGDVSVMQRLKPANSEVVDSGCGFEKAIGMRAVTGVERRLARAFRSIRGLRDDEPSPLFTCADGVHFDALDRSRALAWFTPALRALPKQLRAAYR